MQRSKTERIFVLGVWLAALVYILTLELKHPTHNALATVAPLVLLLIVTLIGSYRPVAAPRWLYRRWLGVTCRSFGFAGALYMAFRVWRHRRLFDPGLKLMLLLLIIVTATGFFWPLRIGDRLWRLLRRRPTP